MSKAKYLTADTADRMAAASEAAFRAMEAGDHPTKAAAAASVEAGLTAKQAKHVALAVNVAQANRAACHNGTPWEKAAAFPIADPEEVANIASKGFRTEAETSKRASDDFAVPPKAPARDTSSTSLRLKSMFPQEEPETVKKAEAPAAAPAPRGPSLWSQLRAVAYATDVAATEAVKCASYGNDWPSAREAARTMYPEAAGIVEKAISTYPQVKRASAEKQAAFVRGDHPYVRAVGLLKQAVDMYVESKAAEDTQTLESDPRLSLFKKAAPGDAGKSEKSKGMFAPFGEVSRGVSNAVLGSAFRQLGSQLSEMGPQIDRGLRTNVMREVGEENMRKDLVNSVNAPLIKARNAVHQVEEQDNINSLLTHPSLAGADPNEILGAYRELRALAPNAMAVPALARQVVGLRVRTGQLGMFDLEGLTRMEANIVKARKDSYEDE